MRPEIQRRLVHTVGAIVPAAYVFDIATWDQIRAILVLGIVLALSIEAARLLVGIDLPGVDRMIRSYEEEYLAGYALYVIGGGIVGITFEPAVAIPAMLMLTLGDPIAGLLSDDELRTIKRPHVLAIMFVVCTAFAWPFLEPEAAFAAAFVATIADGIKPVIKGYVIDDNLTIPVGAAVAAYLVSTFGPSLV